MLPCALDYKQALCVLHDPESVANKITIVRGVRSAHLRSAMIARSVNGLVSYSSYQVFKCHISSENLYLVHTTPSYFI